MCAGRENKLVANGISFVANGNFPEKVILKVNRIAVKKRYLEGAAPKGTHKNRP